ncbi:MAG: 16S rRNA (cytosine(1402)-N(4))-methyltransferase RsmH [Prevotellaceae bacterium]|nr:16S rRNA (cytosine(1402)-N(4))-methyltransferase RsmH [Prevotellaceae bacterium]
MANGQTTYHVPVLLHESIDALCVNGDGLYVDVTFGGGGHSREILRRLTTGHLYGFDQDADAAGNVEASDCFTFVRSNFRYLTNFLRYYGVEQVDGVLADLGVSSHHFDEVARGFSFRFDGPLDMRMNQHGGRTAADIVNAYDEAALADVLYQYGELRQSRRIAAAIVARRRRSPIATTGDLLDAVNEVLRPRPGKGAEEMNKKEMAKVFQALRIEVNQEMAALRDMLTQAVDVLRPGGRLVVITYHSLEDRMVKNLMKTGNCDGREDKDFYGRVSSPLRLVNNKVIVPTAEEQELNPRSRSAKLRIAEKVGATTDD